MNLVEFATRRRVTVAMVTFTFVLFGVIALFDLKVNLLPDLSYPTVTVRTEYTGAAPTEIETLISQPVEEAVGVVKNLRKLKSISRTGQSDVVLEFAWGTNMDQASLEVRDKLDVLRLPLEAKAPVLLRFNPSTEPVMRLVLAVPAKATGNQQAELMRLRRYADNELKKRLEPVDGVAAVKIAGGLEDEVQVLVDADRLAQLNIPADKVIERLKQENVNISGGRIEEGSERYLVRTVNQFSNLDQMRDLLVTNVQGVPVRLRDVATITQTYKEREAVIRFKGREAVELAIYKEGDANTVAVADAVRKALRSIETAGKSGPPGGKPAPVVEDAYNIDGIALQTIEDQSKFIKNALHDVKVEAFIGGVLSILIIFFFLRDGWSTFVIGLSLPVSIISTFFFMSRFGLSLNVMSLAGLALATGMVVDDSIVVLESIAKARERGLGILQSAIVGTREVSMAVVASTLTTVAVFFPLVFVQGVAGQLFKDQALTVSFALLISLVVSLTLIPMLSSIKDKAPLAFTPEDPHPRWTPNGKVGRVAAAGGRGVQAGTRYGVFGLSWFAVAVGRLFGKFIGGPLAWVGKTVLMPYEKAAAYYQRTLPRALDRPWMILGSAALAFVVAMGVATTLGTDLIPQLAQDRFEMTAKLPPGTQLRETDGLVLAVQKAFDGDKDIEALYGVSGTGTRLDANPTESGENVAKLSVVLGEHYSTKTEAAVTERMRAMMAQYPDTTVKFGRPQLLTFSTPLEIELRGTDLDAIERAGKKLSAMMQQSTHFADVKSSVEQGYPEIQIRFDQERAAALGLTSREIADQVVRQVRGEVATRYSFRDRKIDVLVRG
ncbi:MAG: efflux RND transporter permease subunit, partial [Arenimonas sp.]